VKLLVDENPSPRAAASLQEEYPGSRHIEECGLLSASDDEIWTYARTNGFAILTKDSDFSDRGQLENNPPKVIWLRGGNCSTSRALLVLRNASERIRAFFAAELETCLVIFVSGKKDGSRT
jgi:predicted nuclease of predicted toxin-antitoxin system